MAFLSIPSSWIEIGRAVKKELFDRISTDLDDIDTRVTAVETSGLNKVPIWNSIVDLSSMRTGSVRLSMLTESQYQSRFGSEWVQLKGQSISGSELASLWGGTLPDARDRFIRALAASGKSIGQLETQTIASLRLLTGWGIGGNRHDTVDTFGSISRNDTPIYTQKEPGAGVEDWIKPVAGSFGAETRPDSIILNMFVRINDRPLDYVLTYRAPANLSVVSAKISNLEAGVSGNLEVDILKGNDLGSVSTMLNSNLSLPYSAGSFTTSGEASFSVNTLLQNQQLCVNIEALQSGQDRFSISVYGEAS